MSSAANKLYAVLTGDLVKSTSRSKAEIDRARKSLAKVVDELESAPWDRRPTSLVRGDPEFFRGDSWQMLLTDPRWALRVAVVIRLTLQIQAKCDTRVSIGLGTVSSISSKQVSLSRGEAFTLSGHGLDEEMGSRYRLAISVPHDGDNPSGGWLGVVARLCDSVMIQWQGRQLEVVRFACLYPGASQADIAEMLRPKVSQQSVAKTMQRAGWYGFQDALERFESAHWLQP
ncbi:MAG: hypothetical protein CMJ35_12990 [Phycisphaerae bacterium]|jgi:hypothetical protein|nr:hypothetical protein [Phycisphaerae bacterium]MBM92509.1 hypothetical protein [Phycisphaerae bacterium]HCT43622.1 hypothetical protein [Phycisphaerales bacterium]